MKKTYEFAEIVVEAEFQDSYMEKLCRGYESEKPAELFLKVDPEDVRLEEEKSEDGQAYPYGYLESLAFYRKFCEKVLTQNRILFHASAVAVDGKAYLFTAPSGTGKSTHTALWRKVFSERAVMINDDKPVLKVTEQGIFAYGTPWDGKHRLSTNTKVPVQAICILERGVENEIRKEDFYQAYPFILSQTYRADDEKLLQKTLELVNQMMLQIPIFRMKCNISEEAARMAYQAMSGERAL